MADVQIAVRLGREARRRSAIEAPGGDIVRDELADEVPLRGSGVGHEGMSGKKWKAVEVLVP
jgi:hypothetical protein